MFVRPINRVVSVTVRLCGEGVVSSVPVSLSNKDMVFAVTV